MPSLLLLLSLLALALADVPDVHENEYTITVKSGDPLYIKVPAPTIKWHRIFKDSRIEQYIEACHAWADICNKWRSEEHYIDPERVNLADDGTLQGWCTKATATTSTLLVGSFILIGKFVL